MKPVMVILRRLGTRVGLHISGWYAFNDDKTRDHIRVIYLPASLRIVLNVQERVWSSIQWIKFLGFTWYSDTRTISLPFQKLTIALRIRQRRHKQLWEREILRVLGMMVALQPVISLAPIHNRHLKKTKSFYLSSSFSMATLFHWLRTPNYANLKWWIQEAWLL